MARIMDQNQTDDIAEWPLAAGISVGRSVSAASRCSRRDLELHTIDALRRYCAAHPCVNADLRATVIAV